MPQFLGGIMTKLWQKDGMQLNKIVESFETGEDLLLDQKLVEFDVLGSLAHAKMLCQIGILTKNELNSLEKGLKEISNLNKIGKFNLEMGDEDIHSKIENYLTEKYGEAGQKIHTGRSRNDQVLTALRLFTKKNLLDIKKEAKNLIHSFNSFAEKYQELEMPGYTHMQKAMPTTVGVWAKSFSESLVDDLICLDSAIKLNNQSPLGTGAGFGVPILNLDRELTTKLLKFNKVQENPIYCQNSRSKIDAVTSSALISILMTINKFASDIMVFTTSEFSFFQVSDDLITGSSIMPQKKNIDIAELLRSKVNVVLGNYTQIVSLSSNLISGYNRDIQDSKKALMENLDITSASLKVTNILLNNLLPNKKSLATTMTPELYATEEAFKLVKTGVPFREAYQKIGKLLRQKGGVKNGSRNK
jgi:argininosuccinate lyase